jgi:hypothetical protein
MKSTKQIRRENLAHFIQEVGSVRSFIEKFGHLYGEEGNLTHSYLNQLLSANVGIGDKTARKLEKAMGKPEFWLDQDRYSHELPAHHGDGDVVHNKLKQEEGVVLINQFDTGGSMGGGVVLHDQPGVIHSWQVSKVWVEKNVKSYTSIDNLAVVTGFGDSMKGLFNPGDPLIIDTGIKTVEVDGAYFFRVGEKGFIKRLQYIPGQGILVISENSIYRDWTITEDMDFEVFGRVLKVWHSCDL